MKSRRLVKMAFFELKKRCPYCGTALDENGNCPKKEG